MRFDTPIEVTEESGSTAEEAKRCGSKLTDSGSVIAKTLSTNETIDVVDLLQEAQQIRKKRDVDTENVVSGNQKFLIVITSIFIDLYLFLICHELNQILYISSGSCDQI